MVEEILQREILEGLRANEQQILSGTLDNGWDIVRGRSTLADRVLGGFFDRLVGEYNPDFDFVFAATGGYGRRELSPNSDIDTILLYDSGVPDDNPFLAGYMDSLRELFSDVPGFIGQPIINTLQDIPDFITAQFSELLELRMLRGSPDFEKKFREELRDQNRPIEFILNRLSELDEMGRKYPEGLDNVPFNLKYGRGALRHFQIAVNTLGIEDYEPSTEVYGRIPRDVIESVGIIFRARAWLNLRKGLTMENLEKKAKSPTKRTSDDFTVQDLTDFEEHFGRGSIKRLYDARYTVNAFSERAIFEKRKAGIPVAESFVYGINGLELAAGTPSSKRNRRFYDMLHEMQRYGLNASPDTANTFLRTGQEFVRPDNIFLDLLNNGAVYPILDCLLEFRLLGNIMPGFSSLETSFYQKSHRNSSITRARQAVYRIGNLESIATSANGDAEDASENDKFLAAEFRQLDSEQLVALKLALLTKAIPQIRGIPTEEYVRGELSSAYPRLPKESLDLIVYLVDNKNLLFEAAQRSIEGYPEAIDNILKTTPDLSYPRCLLFFTLADLDYRTPPKRKDVTSNLNPTQLEQTIHLYRQIIGQSDVDSGAQYSPHKIGEFGVKIAEKLPERFFRSRYQRMLLPYASGLQSVNDTKKPIVRMQQLSYSNDSYLLVVASEDFPGLLWRVAGKCLEEGLDIHRAEIYSIGDPYALAFDFFEIGNSHSMDIQDFESDLTSLLEGKGDVSIKPRTVLNTLNMEYSVDYFPDIGTYSLTLHAKDKRGILYAVTRILSEEVGVNIISTNAHGERDGRIYDTIFFKVGKSYEEVKRLIDGNFNMSEIYHQSVTGGRKSNV